MLESAKRAQSPKRFRPVISFLAITMMLFVSSLNAQQTEDFKLVASDGELGDAFGTSVSVSGNVALVGAGGDDGVKGAAYVFRYDSISHSWDQEAKLTASDGQPGDYFGRSVSLSGNCALVGAYQKNNSLGAAYLYRYNGNSWSEEAIISASDGQAGDQFGWTVSLSGDCALIGALGPYTSIASAYIFRYDSGSWSEESKLTPSDGQPRNLFACSLCLSNDRALIGAIGDCSETGAAYVYRYDSGSWFEEAKITDPNGSSHGRFGRTVAISGKLLMVVGTRLFSPIEVFVFEFDPAAQSWNEKDTITKTGSSNPSLSLEGNTALLGMGLSSSNEAYLFDYDPVSQSLVERACLIPSDGHTDDLFGYSVSLCGNFALVGSHRMWQYPETAYLFDLDLSPVIYVHDDYPTIQQAIDAASAGNTIIVKPGTYFENLDFSGKAITVRSSHGAEATVIDGQMSGSVVTFSQGEDFNTVLEGFTITNGSGTYISNWDAYGGCGIYCENSSPTIQHNTITGNSHAGRESVGGGIFTSQSSPKIIGNRITENTVDWGGGMSCHGVQSPHSIHVENNFIIGNTAYGVGGGIDGVGTNMVIINNTIVGNSASESEGGGGISIDDTIAEVDNCIVWNNSYYTGYEIALHSEDSYSVMNISHSDVMNKNSSVFEDWDPSWSHFNEGTGMIDADPLFADEANDDLHITWNSPCRDSGDNSAATEEYDIEGDPREVLSTVDMGADEYHYHLYHLGEIAPGASIEIKVIGYPTAPVKLYLGSGVVDPPHSTQHGDFFLEWPPVWDGKIGKCESDGICKLQATVPQSWSTGEEHPIQALVGPWGGGGGWTRFTNMELLVVK